MTLTDDEIAVFYAIFTCAERVDWACYEAFRLAILTEGAKQTTAAPLAADPPAFQVSVDGVLDCAEGDGG